MAMSRLVLVLPEVSWKLKKFRIESHFVESPSRSKVLSIQNPFHVVRKSSAN